jgi:Tfp pilus assembly protein PilN
MSTPRLCLEFVPRARPVSRLGVAMLMVGVGVLAIATVQLGQRLAGNARQQQALEALQARHGFAKNDARRAAAADPNERDRVKAVRRVAQSLTMPWSDMLESLEAAPSQSVALLSVEPSVAKRSIRIKAEARHEQDMLDYLGALQHDTRLAGVVLVSHEVQAKTPGSPVRFQIQAVWGIAP